MTTDQIELRQTDDGVYRRVGATPTTAGRRFTAYVSYGDADHVAVEEIDVDASTERDAWDVAAAALARDYETGGRIVGVEERTGWYW